MSRYREGLVTRETDKGALDEFARKRMGGWMEVWDRDTHVLYLLDGMGKRNGK